jgi:Xaa-Pro aminopeptidase
LLPQIDPTPHLARRQALAQHLGDGVVVVPTAPERPRNRDSHYPFRYDSYFYYLTGFPEPEAVLVMVLGREPRHYLFCRERNEEKEIWDGYRYGPGAAREAFGFDEAHPIATLDEKLAQLLANQPAVHFALGMDPSWDTHLTGWLAAVRAQVRNGVTAPTRIHDIRATLDEMRLFKDGHEQALMRRAADITAGAHRRAMRFALPGQREYEIEAELLHEFRRHGAEAPAYSPIVAAGANACVLHYVENRAVIGESDLILIDAGCEYGGYAADITRTFPASGRFSGPQRELYELVLASQHAAIASVRPGNDWDAPHAAALRVLAQGFVDLGLCQGSADGVIESGDYKRFYMHKTGHWLGLDVHDAGDYRIDGAWRPLLPGMTLTVEPGCYVRPAPGVPERFCNIGIRIEDDVLVTDAGCEVLTAAAPKTIAEIETCMAER